MENKVLFIISTTLIQAPKMTAQLLNISTAKCDRYKTFGSNFYPVVGINIEGAVSCICDKSNLVNDLLVIIVCDTAKFDADFLNYIKLRVDALDFLYLLFHDGSASLHGTHQKELFEKCKGHLAKVRVAKNHHTISQSQSPQFALGDGLEMVATSILENSIDVPAFKAGVDYLKAKPDYINPVKESLIHLHKSLKLIPLKLKQNWKNEEFKKQISGLDNDKIHLAKDWLNSISFKDDITDYYTQLDSIENEITELSKIS